MKFIQKNPSAINKWLYLYKDKNTTYDVDVKNERVKNNKNNYDKTLDDLLKEQGYICAYCMRKISDENTKIEHFIGQEYIDESGNEIGKKEDTNYQNMLAVCCGNYCQKKLKAKERLHCDSSRSIFQTKYKESENKNKILSTYRPKLYISPLNSQQMKQIGFTRSGVIFYKELKYDDTLELQVDKDIRYDLNIVLNLNCGNLKEARNRIIESIDSSLRRHNYSKSFAQKELAHWKNTQNNNKEYCEVAICKLENFLKDK